MNNHLLPPRPLELLAPAKNLECGIAAIDHGADAVYIGGQRFGARAAVGNSVEDIRQLCLYAHRYGAKVYVTVNTIIFDHELDDTRRLISQLHNAGADAILVQDMGILRLSLPPIALHASTQTDNRTAEKVRWLHSLGFRRVVLARELSVDEITVIHRQEPDVELEAFVHGALCVSYSGLCYASQYCFGRSANRGQCAQFCRMKFDLLDADGRELEHQRYLLSLKDMNRLSHLQELADAGVQSFKIEGRLKDAYYVKNVVAAYSQQLDAVIARSGGRYCRASRGQVTYCFTPNLRKTFNRGFTTYFLHGRQSDCRDVFSPDTPKAMGEFVGTVKELRRDSFNVAGTASFANGDGLCYVNSDRTLEGFRINRVEGNRLYPHKMPRTLRPGMALYRNNDQQFERLLSRQSAERKLPLTFRIDSVPTGFSLSAGGHVVTADCSHQQASTPQHDNIQRQLSRLGGTPFACSGVEIPAGFDYFVPNSVLTQLRQQLVTLLMEQQSAAASADVPADEPRAEVTAASVAERPQAYAYDYFYNIANRQSAQFYGQCKPSAFELQGGNGPLMQCRHCLRFAYGYCVQHGGRRPQWREPLSLRLSDGRLFRLEFDCRHCQMNVYSSEK